MFALLTARSEPMADASFPAMRARRRPGTAIAAMIPMMATTISSSISVKPLVLRIFMMPSSFRLETQVGGDVIRHRAIEQVGDQWSLASRKRLHRLANE